jgi:hypothetical protein
MDWIASGDVPKCSAIESLHSSADSQSDDSLFHKKFAETLDIFKRQDI